MRAFLYGSEVEILHFYRAERGTPFCQIRVLDTGWINSVPTSCIELRRI